jgi:DNA-binding MarR family transcriptional regulator
MPTTKQSQVVFRACARHLQGAWAALQLTDPPPAIVLMFYTVCAEPGRTVSALAKDAGLTLKNASRTLQALRKTGWVELRIGDGDTRQRRVHLSKTGQGIARLIIQSATGMAYLIVEATSGRVPHSHRKR